MDISFEENLSSCIEKLRIDNFRGATTDLYPVSKQTCRLGNASDNSVSKFVEQMIGVLEVMKVKIGDVQQLEDFDNARYVLMDVYRILRTSCTANTLVQDEFGGSQGARVMECTRSILDSANRHFHGESLIQSLAVGIHFLSNLASGCQKNQDLVWDHFQAQLKNWLDVTKKEPENTQERTIKVVNYACAVIDSCLPRQWERNPKFLEDPTNNAVLLSAIQANAVWKLEFGKKAMMKIVQIPGIWQNFLCKLNHQERCSLMFAMSEVIADWRSNDEKGPEVPSLHGSLCFLIEYLIREAAYLTPAALSIPEASSSEEMHLQVRALEVLSTASCCATFANDLSSFTVQRAEEPKTLLLFCLGLLNDIHKKGREGFNMLTMVTNHLDVDDTHPGFMLRRDLIRTIGNLVYDNKKNQDLVRESYGKIGIPFLFDHTFVDKRNPFCQEWAKLALTNLLRDNSDNAAFVKSMKLQAHIDTTGILAECGLTLETKGDKVVVKPAAQTMNLGKLAEKAPARP